MQLSKDDRVEMPTMPDWGLGRVIHDAAGGKVSVHFREAGEKVLSLKHANLVRREGESASDDWLDNLCFDAVARDLRYLGPREVLRLFLERYPGGFRDAAFEEEHRASKVDAHEFALEVLDREASRDLIAREAFDDYAKRVLKLVARTNLVYPVEKSALNRALKDAERRPEFVRVVDDLLYGDDRPDVRFKRYCDELEAIGAARWTLATYFTFIRYPDEHMLFKPTFTQQAAALCRFDLRYRPEPNRATYGRLLAFARVLGDVVADLHPRDMFDIQGLIWSIAQEKD